MKPLGTSFSNKIFKKADAHQPIHPPYLLRAALTVTDVIVFRLERNGNFGDSHCKTWLLVKTLLVNIKIAGKWMFIPTKNGINRY